jgi:uncharacterized protein (UPF0332 family)
MTLNEKDKKELIKYNIERANKAINDVEFLIENQRYHLATNRIYYGIYYILSALALKHSFQTSKHTQLIGWFNKNFVKNGILEKRFGKYIQNAFEQRMEGDYGTFVNFEKEEIDNSLKEMKEVINRIIELLT